MTLLLFRPNGLAPGVPLRDKLLAPFRILKGVTASLVGHHPMPLPDMSVASIGGAMIDSLNRFWKGPQPTRTGRGQTKELNG